MNAERLKSLWTAGVAFDLETHKTQPGLKAPPTVCGSLAANDNGKFSGVLVTADMALDAFINLLRDKSKIIVGANIAFDMLCMAVRAAGRGIDLMPLIFAAYAEERVFDVLIAEQLHAIAEGTLGKDPSTGKPLADEEQHRAGYSLEIVTWLVLGRRDAKVNDRYRGSYALLEPYPINQWPPEAQQYPVDDAVNTLEVALAQAGLIPRPSPHVWPSGGPGSDVCTCCGYKLGYDATPPCTPRLRRSRNLHDLANQCFTAWAMHLGAAWGFMVDQAAVDKVEAKVLASRGDRATPFFNSGLFKWVTKKGEKKAGKDTAVIAHRVAKAYGCNVACKHCEGKQKVWGPKTKLVRCRTCKGAAIVAGLPCVVCNASGKQPDKLIQCKPCGASGFDLDSAVVPRTDGGKCKACNATGEFQGSECEVCEGAGIIQGVGAGRDSLTESGDDELIDFADYTEDAKITETYIPWLREGRDPYTHAPIPLVLRPNVLLETGRTSYYGVVQLLPRKGGIRECIVARPGYVFCSVDYEAGELVTHAENCNRIVGSSVLAKALNEGIKVHNSFAATVLDLMYEVFQQRFDAKDKQCIDIRQAAKPANFGFPGRMGAAKLVLQQRKQGPDTECAGGPSLIHIDDGTPDGKDVQGYKGLRFCILMDGAKSCGDVKVTEWKRRPLPPTCKHCIECAERLRVAWLAQWPENNKYFDWVKYVEENGQPINPEDSDFYGVPANSNHLAPAEIIQHVSKRVRGVKAGDKGSPGNAIANGYFQGLLADATKSALRRASREMYDSTYRLADGSLSPLYGSRFILFAHDELIAELPESNMHAAAFRLSQIMEEELKIYCPTMVRAVKAEPALMRRWFKGATPWWKIGGKKRKGPEDTLVPWHPGIEKEWKAAA